MKTDLVNLAEALKSVAGQEHIDLPTDYDELSPTERRDVREAYEVRQGGKCWHCKKKLYQPASKEVRKLPVNKKLFPHGFFDFPVHLHHCHESGLTIGAVHAYCNAVLWQYYGE